MLPGRAARMNPELKKFFKTWLVTTFAVLVTTAILGHKMRYAAPVDLFVAAFLLGILNAFLRPLLFFLALPLLIGTLGLFMVVINGLLLYLVQAVMGTRFQIDGFGWAMLASILIGLISFPLNLLTGNTTSQIRLQRKPAASRTRRDDDEGPVIDV
jgi:putative membrane protein